MPWLNSCLCSPDDKPKPSVSAPLHLILKGESSDSRCHAFRTKQFKKARPCNLCHQPIQNQGSSCRVCKYVCHKSCEDKVTDKHHGFEAPSPRTPSSIKQDDKERWRSSRRKGTGMDLSYVTERILALWFPQETSQDAFLQGHRDAAAMLHGKHPNSYMLFNLSEGCWDGGQSEHERTAEMGWSKDLAPPLDRLCAVCKEMDSWLSADPTRIAVLHARGSKERIGVVVAAYMHYSSICGSPEQALDRFAMKRFLDHKIGELELPSNRRYVEYFSGLLSGSIRINSASLYLTHVTVLGAPAFERCGSGCRAFIKVYEGLVPVYTSGVHTVSGDTRQFTVTVANQHRKGLQLRGDILIKCYHRHYCTIEDDVEGSPLRCSSPEPPIYRELIFACQFHTCAVSDHTLSFTRNQLDSACNDLRFPLDGAVELHFGARGEARTLPAPTPAVPVDTAPDPVTAWDSLQHLENIVSPPSTPPDSDRSDDQHNADCLGHTYGPVDGSLYATVAKKDSLSMDSGISSAGNGLLASKPHPVQTEVGADLDRLLDEMLMTVRDIPDLDVPYHSRSDSRPFTYGQLASPGLVRKASIKRSQSSGPPVPASPRSPDFHEGETFVQLSRGRSGNIVSGSAMRGEGSWLQRQQAKLRERREAGTRWDRAGLLWELKSSPSRRPDGYASDTTHLDDDDLTDFGRPMMMNSTTTRPGSAPVSPLLPHRSSSRQPNRHTKERAFVHLRRARDTTDKYNDLSPDGVDASTDSGLLSLAGSSAAAQTTQDTLSCLMESLSAGHEAISQHSASNSSDDNHTADTWPHGQPLDHQLRDDSSGWRSGGSDGSPTHTSGSPRPNTPAFPVYPRTPYSNNLSNSNFDTLPPKSPTISRKEWSSVEGTLSREHSTVSSLRGYESSDNQHSPRSPLTNGSINGLGGSSPSPTVYYGHSRRSSIHSNGEPPTEVSPAHVKFVRDTSRFWYKPTISREEAIALLRDRSPGTFVVRDSNSFPGAFGLALKVATPPPGTRPTGDPSNELVRHFLIEPTSRGVKLKGCQNEPVFSSLSALVYQHSVTPLALPCRLCLPETDLRISNEPAQSTAHMLLTQGAACNVLYLTSVEMESLTGPQAVVRAVECFFTNPPGVAPAIVHFKVSSQGITLTDNKRQIFFRRHYPVASISYCGLDPDDRRFEYRPDNSGLPHASLRVFGFVARKPASGSDNQCHVFAELEPEQPATAIVNFVSKVMMNSNQPKNIV